MTRSICLIVAAIGIGWRAYSYVFARARAKPDVVDTDDEDETVRPLRLRNPPAGQSVRKASMSVENGHQWCVLAPQQRMNIIDDAPVGDAFFRSMRCAGFARLDSLDGVLLTSTEMRLLLKVIQVKGIESEGLRVQVYIGRVRHHLRRGTSSTHHHEVWAMLGIGDLLVPVKRVSELTSHVGAPIYDEEDLVDFVRFADAHPNTRMSFEERYSDDLHRKDDEESGDVYMVARKLQGLRARDIGPKTPVRVWLRENTLSMLPAFVGKWSSVRCVDLSKNSFFAAPSVLAELPNLQELDLSNNPLSRTNALESLSRIASLRRLDVSNAQLAEFPEDLPSELTHLSAHGNDIGTLPTAIGALRDLEFLSLHSNRLERLPDEITRLKKLIWLSLNANLLVVLPDDIGALVELERLSLHSNRLTNVPVSLGRCTKLIALSLFHNRISELPDSVLEGLANVTTFCLFDNDLTAVPSSIEHMTALEDLWLSANPLTSLPRELTRCTKLKRLWIENTGVSEFEWWHEMPATLEDVFVRGSPESLRDSARASIFRL
jgi:Leucine-rich repeat (LRR) protein